MVQPMWPFFYCAGRLTLLQPSDTPQDCFFGGPFELKIAGRQDRLRLHRTLTLTGGDIDLPSDRRLMGRIPLVYAYQYEQNRISYRLRGSAIPGQGTSLDRTSIYDLSLDGSTYLEDWPYRDYPAILPYVNLQAGQVLSVTGEEFRSQYLEHEMPIGSSEVVVGVPTNRTLSCSMWGLEGDQQDILLIFVLDTKTLQITAWHRLP